MEKYAYYLIFKESSRGGELYFNIGGTSKDSTIVKLRGRRVKEIFGDTVKLLSRYGGIIPQEITDAEKTYGIKEDLGPIIGAYILLLRRARNYKKWHSFLKRLLNEEFPGIAIILSNFLNMALELSKTWTTTNSNGKVKSKKALDIISSTLKHFADRVERM